MATKKKSTKAVATPKVKRTKHKVILERYGFKLGQELNLVPESVEFYRNKNVIK